MSQPVDTEHYLSQMRRAMQTAGNLPPGEYTIKVFEDSISIESAPKPTPKSPTPAEIEHQRALDRMSQSETVSVTLPRHVLELLVEGFDMAGDGGISPFYDEQRAYVNDHIGAFRAEAS